MHDFNFGLLWPPFCGVWRTILFCLLSYEFIHSTTYLIPMPSVSVPFFDLIWFSPIRGAPPLPSRAPHPASLMWSPLIVFCGLMLSFVSNKSMRTMRSPLWRVGFFDSIRRYHRALLGFFSLPFWNPTTCGLFKRLWHVRVLRHSFITKFVPRVTNLPHLIIYSAACL